MIWPGIIAAGSGLFLVAWWLMHRPIRGCACGRCRRGTAVMPRCTLGNGNSSAELEFRTGPMGGRTVVLSERYIAIGSVAGPSEGDIILADPAVSKQHARIERKRDCFVLHDLGSTNGTYVNGLRHRKLVLCCDDTILLGNSEIVFRLRS